MAALQLFPLLPGRIDHAGVGGKQGRAGRLT
jgi:hypothetical protein